MKEFFQKKEVMIAESILLVAAAGGLLIGGVSLEGITNIAKATAAVLASIDAIATLIAALVNNKDKKAA